MASMGMAKERNDDGGMDGDGAVDGRWMGGGWAVMDGGTRCLWPSFIPVEGPLMCCRINTRAGDRGARKAEPLVLLVVLVLLVN